MQHLFGQGPGGGWDLGGDGESGQGEGCFPLLSKCLGALVPRDAAAARTLGTGRGCWRRVYVVSSRHRSREQQSHGQSGGAHPQLRGGSLGFAPHKLLPPAALLRPEPGRCGRQGWDRPWAELCRQLPMETCPVEPALARLRTAVPHVTQQRGSCRLRAGDISTFTSCAGHPGSFLPFSSLPFAQDRLHQPGLESLQPVTTQPNADG